jgi:hypothetical protein
MAGTAQPSTGFQAIVRAGTNVAVARAMNEQKLQRLFQGIVLGSLPLIACGGATGGDDLDQGMAGSSSRGSAGASTGGSAGTGSGGTGSGGDAGGSDAGGTSPGGSNAGGSAGTGNGGTGALGSGGSGGLGCTGPSASCLLSRSVVVARDCADPTQPLSAEHCSAFCPASDDGGFSTGCTVESYDDVSITVSCYPCAAVGRRPVGFTPRARSSRSLGDELSQIALLEAASVHAFRDLRRELAVLGAPRSLLRGLSRAARDETRHARRTSALARRFGGQVQPTPTLPRASRTLAAIAEENMSEGCVRETFGALVAHYQARHARHPELAAAFARIAREETRHAALSFALDRWLSPRLDGAARARVQQARREAAARLYAELGAQGPDDPERLAGFPDPALARALFRQAFAALFTS